MSSGRGARTDRLKAFCGRLLNLQRLLFAQRPVLQLQGGMPIPRHPWCPAPAVGSGNCLSGNRARDPSLGTHGSSSPSAESSRSHIRSQPSTRRCIGADGEGEALGGRLTSDHPSALQLVTPVPPLSHSTLLHPGPGGHPPVPMSTPLLLPHSSPHSQQSGSFSKWWRGSC